MSKLTLTVVDDDRDICSVLEVCLRDKYEISVLTRGDDGWDYIKENKPDIAILDLVMPGMDGLTILENIRKNPETKNTKVIIITATTKGSELPDGFWKQGIEVDGFVSKPFEPIQVVKLLDKILTTERS